MVRICYIWKQCTFAVEKYIVKFFECGTYLLKRKGTKFEIERRHKRTLKTNPVKVYKSLLVVARDPPLLVKRFSEIQNVKLELNYFMELNEKIP